MSAESKRKIYVSWLHEKYQYQNIFFFSGAESEADILDNIRKMLETQSCIFGKKPGQFPGAIRLFMGRHEHEIPGERFFFRSWFDIETNNIVYEETTKEIFELLDNNSQALLYTEHPNKYVKMFADMILRAPWMNDVEFITNHIYLDPEDELKKVII